MRQRNLLFVYASSEKNLREKKEPSLLERTSFLLRFGEHRDNSINSQSVFLVVASYICSLFKRAVFISYNLSDKST